MQHIEERLMFRFWYRIWKLKENQSPKERSDLREMQDQPSIIG